MRDNKSRSCYTYMNFDHTTIQPSPNEKSTISLILLFKKICRIVCHPLPAPLPPTTVGDVTLLPAPQLCLFNVLSLSEFVPCEYVLDLVWLGLRLTKKAYQRHPDPKNEHEYSHERWRASQPGEVARKKRITRRSTVAQQNISGRL